MAIGQIGNWTEIGRNSYWPKWLLAEMVMAEMALDEMGLNEVAIPLEKIFFDYLLNPTQEILFMKPILADEIVKIISKFYQNNSPGHDSIGNFIVKNVAHIISGPLADIFNLSLSTGSVPEQLKVLRLFLYTYKKENAEIFSNYRPVSVLPCFSKILERLIFNRCMDYINNYKILNEKQFGSRNSPGVIQAFYIYGYNWVSG